MRKFILFSIFTFFLLSCSNDDGSDVDVELLGRWQLIEIYSDPGDGSGTFESIESNKIVDFNADGNLTANGELCVLNGAADAEVSGTYSESELTISTPNCLTMRYEIQGRNLIISIPCTEPCETKFRKI